MKQKNQLFLWTILVALSIQYRVAESHFTTVILSPQKADESYMLPSSFTLKTFGLNYNTLTADIVWINALLYFTESRHEKLIQRPEYIIPYAEAIIDIDNKLHSIYSWLISTYTQTRGQLTGQEIATLQGHLDTAISQYPSDYRLYYEAGLLGIGYSEERAPQDRIKELDKSIPYLQECLKLSRCPDNTAFVVSWMYNRRSKLEAELQGAAPTADGTSKSETSFYLEVYPRLTDPALRARMRKQLLDMGVEAARLDALEREQVGLVRLDYEARAPYLPLDLWALTVSPRP